MEHYHSNLQKNLCASIIRNLRRFFLFFLFCFPLLLKAQKKSIKHVILIGIDGLGANYLAKASNVPVMQELMRNGSYTLHARCVSPSSSADNWASMIMGAGPELHGYTQWDSKKPEIPSWQIDQYGMFPSIFTLLREQKPNAKVGVIYTWPGIGYLFPKKAVDKDDNANYDSLTVEHAVQYIKSDRPDFLFVHFSNVDGAGHNIGWGTPAYYSAIQQIDVYIGQIVKAAMDAGMDKDGVVIVTSDHGGIKTGHGGKTVEEMEIPWIICGAGIKKDQELNQSIMTFDTAATLAYIFGLKMPQVWIGRAVKSAFIQP